MAFPTVQATAATSDGSQHATSDVNLPTGIVAGDLIVIIASVAASITVSTSGEYTQLAAVNDGSAGMRLWVGYKYATGSEGSTVTLSFSGGPGSSVCTAITYRISGVNAVVPPEIATATTTFQASKNPPNLAPSWGSNDNLWITGIGSRGDTTPTVRPTGYSNSVDQATAAAHHVYTDRKTAAAASDDPSAYTSAATWYVAFTLAVAPGAASSPAPAPGRSSGSSGKSPTSGGGGSQKNPGSSPNSPTWPHLVPSLRPSSFPSLGHHPLRGISMSNIFSAVIDAVAVSAVQDLITVTAPTDKVVIVRRVEIGQDASETAEVLPVQIKRGTSNTAGSGGASVTPRRLKTGTTAASSTVTRNNTTQAVAGGGSLLTVGRRSFNVVTGFLYEPTDLQAIELAPGESLIFALPTAPGAALTVNCEVIFEEL